MQTLVGSLLLTAVVIYAGIADVFFAHEFWAGSCITLSLIAYSRGCFILSLGSGICALLVRELSFPFVSVMIIMALIEKRRKEFLSWVFAIIGFSTILLMHGYFIKEFVTDPLFPQKGGWISFGGWPFVLNTIQMHPFLILNPPWLNAILIPLLLLGLAGWKGMLGTRISLLVCTYILAFLVMGQPFNVYWGVMFNILIPIGALYTLPSILDLSATLSQNAQCRRVRHPPQSGWLDKWGRLKGGRPLCLTPINLKSFSPFGKLNPDCLHELGHISNGEKGIAAFPMLPIPVISASCSDLFRPPVPVHSGRQFRRIPATPSERSDAGVEISFTERSGRVKL